jgi:hypothetical protein
MFRCRWKFTKGFQDVTLLQYCDLLQRLSLSKCRGHASTSQG